MIISRISTYRGLRLGLASPASPFCVGESSAPDPTAAPAESSSPAACADCSCPQGPQNDETGAFCERVDNVDFPAAYASGSKVFCILDMDSTCTASRDRQFSSWAKSSGKLALLRICPNKCCRSILAAVLSQMWLQI